MMPDEDANLIMTPESAAAMADSAAALFRNRKITGGRVILALKNSTAFAAALLGGFKAGLEMVLVDHGSLSDIQKALDLTGAAAVIAEEEQYAALCSCGAVLMHPGEFTSVRAERSSGSRLPDSGNYVLFTSGSTGGPRGVVYSMERIRPELESLKRILSLKKGERVTSLVSWCHIYGLHAGLLAPLDAGCSVRIANEAAPARMLEIMHAEVSDVVLLTPAQLRPLGTLAMARQRRSYSRLASSGAHLADDVSEVWRDTLGAKVTDIYGSTEAGGVAFRTGQTVFSPFEHVECMVRPGKRGAEESTPDELFVRSPVSALSALGEGEEESGLVDDDGFLATGDAVEKADNGFVLIGRMDGIVKLGGRRVSLHEIEKTIMSTGLAENAVAWMHKRGAGHERELWAAVVPAASDTAEIRRRLGEALPPYRRPRRIVALESFPGTRPGKISIEMLDSEAMRAGGRG